MRAYGIVTKINENDAEGSWTYEYDEYREFYKLDIQLVDSIDGNLDNIRYETLGSRSGFWTNKKTFIHIAEMNQSIEENYEGPVYVFALGNNKTFEAAKLQDSNKNEELYASFLEIPTKELLDKVRDVIDSSDEIIYGTTTNIQFARDQISRSTSNNGKNLLDKILNFFNVLFWFIGALFFVVGVSEFVAGNNITAIQGMGLGLVFISVGSEEKRNNLTNFFYSLMEKIWKSIKSLGN